MIDRAIVRAVEGVPCDKSRVEGEEGGCDVDIDLRTGGCAVDRGDEVDFGGRPVDADRGVLITRGVPALIPTSCVCTEAVAWRNDRDAPGEIVPAAECDVVVSLVGFGRAEEVLSGPH